jgi:hypothetical protein
VMAANVFENLSELLQNNCDLSNVSGLDLTDVESVDRLRELFDQAYEVLREADLSARK